MPGFRVTPIYDDCSVLRHATPTALRPIVLAGRAGTAVLTGVQTQLRPGQRTALLDKYKV